jgi:hypothetical protein
MKNAWPIGIALFLVVFAGGLVVFVMAALRKPEQLVRSDYYEHEIAYQQHIDRELGAADLQMADLVRLVPGTGMVVTLPAGSTQGVIHLYRPSDARLDREWTYAPGADGRHVIAATDLAPGTWRIRLTWLLAGRESYKETLLTLAP